MQPTEPLSEVLVRRKAALAVGLVAGLAAALVYTALAKPRWEAKTTILFAPSTPSFANLSGAAAAIASQSTSSLLGGSSVLRINKMLLESERTLEYVRQNVRPPGTLSEQRSKLRANRDVVTDQSSNTLTLSVRSDSPESARHLSHLYLRSLVMTTKAFNLQRSSSDVERLERALTQKQRDLEKAQTALQNFEESSRTALSLVNIGGQGDSGAALATPGPWQSNLRSAEIELSNAKDTLWRLTTDAAKSLGVSQDLPTYVTFTEKLRQNVINHRLNVRLLENRLGPEAPDLIRARRDLGASESQLKEEVARYQKSLGLGTADISLTQAAIKEAQLQGNVDAYRQLSIAAPGEAKKYTDLVQRVAILSSITNKFEAQLTVARLSEGNDPNRWDTVDDAIVSDKPVNKSYLRNGAIGGLGGAMIVALGIVAGSGRRRRTRSL